MAHAEGFEIFIPTIEKKISSKKQLFSSKTKTNLEIWSFTGLPWSRPESPESSGLADPLAVTQSPGSIADEVNPLGVKNLPALLLSRVSRSNSLQTNKAMCISQKNLAGVINIWPA